VDVLLGAVAPQSARAGAARQLRTKAQSGEIGRLMYYAARRRRDKSISTAFVESAVGEIIAKRMNKKQQMRWSRAAVQPFLDVRTAVLNDTLEDAFRSRHPGFRPANDDHKATAAAA